MRVVAWNMAHRVRSWTALGGLEADVALLSEARVGKGVKANFLGGERTDGRDGYRRPWATAIVSPHALREIDDARSWRGGRPVKVPFERSRTGSWTAAIVRVPDVGDVTAVTLYGLMDEKSDASLHRSLSELAPVFDDPRYNRLLLLGGDLNTWTGWPAASAHLARDRVVLERIHSYGLVDCLRAKRPAGRLDGCPCSLGGRCRHTRTRLDTRYPEIPYQMDYLFASTELAKVLMSCEALPSDRWPSPSDHFPIVATFLPKARKLNPRSGALVAEELRRLNVTRTLLTVAERGHVTSLSCEVPECLCPEELGGRKHFVPVDSSHPDWMPTADHSPILKSRGGHRTVDNVRLAHRLCNRVEAAKESGRSYARDLARVEAARAAAISKTVGG
jgi:hypothetical protein